MPKVKQSGGQQDISQVQGQGLGNQDPAVPRSRTSSLRDSLVANANNNNGVKIENKEPLTVTQDKVHWFEWNRRYDRIKDIANMLEVNGALTQRERKWLKDLGDRDYAKYCELGDLLGVRMIGRSGHHGVWSVGDRNKIRMQTMKAALYEAMKTYDPDGSWIAKEATIKNALQAAKEVRHAMTRETPGPNLNMHNYVTKKTLLDPRIIYREYNRKFANQWLYHDITWMQNIHPDISEHDQKRVAKAVELLVVNDLLTKDAVLKLEDLLRKQPKLVRKLMQVSAKRVRQSIDRDKIRALTLLAFAYNSYEGAEYVKDWAHSTVNSDAVPGLTDKTRRLLEESGSVSIVSDPMNVERPAYEWLPDLPRDGNASKDLCNMWLAWAQQFHGKDDIKSDIPNELKVEEDLNNSDNKGNKPSHQPVAQLSSQNQGHKADDFLGNDFLDDVRRDKDGLIIIASENPEEADGGTEIKYDSSRAKPPKHVYKRKDRADDAKADDILKTELPKKDPKISSSGIVDNLNKSLSPSISDDVDLNETDNVNETDNNNDNNIESSSNQGSLIEPDYDLERMRRAVDDLRQDEVMNEIDLKKVYRVIDDDAGNYEILSDSADDEATTNNRNNGGQSLAEPADNDSLPDNNVVNQSLSSTETSEDDDLHEQ